MLYIFCYGVGYYTHNTMAGFIRLEPKYLDADPTDLTVTLSMPKQYVEKDSIRIPPFSTNSTITEYTIGSVEENGENYTISIYFTVYDRTQTLMLPFTLSFLDDVVPDNYRLPVTVSVSGGGLRAAGLPATGPLSMHWDGPPRPVNTPTVPDGLRQRSPARNVVATAAGGGREPVSGRSRPTSSSPSCVHHVRQRSSPPGSMCADASFIAPAGPDTLPSYTDRDGWSRPDRRLRLPDRRPSTRLAAVRRRA